MGQFRKHRSIFSTIAAKPHPLAIFQYKGDDAQYRPSSQPCSPERRGSCLDLAEADGTGVAGRACVKRLLINSHAHKGIEVSRTSHIFQMSPHTLTILKSRGQAHCCPHHSFAQKQERPWHKELEELFQLCQCWISSRQIFLLNLQFKSALIYSSFAGPAKPVGYGRADGPCSDQL